MKKLLINIWAYSYHARFQIEHAEDNAKSVENAIVDKLGVNDIKWEYVGANVYASDKYRITYEEVMNDTRPIQAKKVLGVEVGTGASI